MVYSFDTVIKGVELRFKTEDGVFSPSGIDKGTLAMLSQVVFSPGDRVLDLGCGYGVVGILAAKLIGSEQVVMLDRDPRRPPSEGKRRFKWCTRGSRGPE